MQSLPAEWRIDSYQVPVPTGDCSLHLLVSVSKEGDEVKNFIERSIIVDSGEDAEAASIAIENTIQALNRKYDEEITTFDFWLITHWGKDHYAGALKYFTKDDIKQKPIVFDPVQFNGEKWDGGR